MLSRLPWAVANAVLWLAAAAAGVTAGVHPWPGVRCVCVALMVVLVASWVAHTLADHYDAVTDENEMLAGQRHVVFGATEEAEPALIARVQAQARTARARTRQNRRRRTPPAGIPAVSDATTTPYRTWLDGLGAGS